jgi:hypothetical protein
VEAQFMHFERWVEGLVLCAKVCVLVRQAAHENSRAASDADRLAGSLAELQSYAECTRTLLDADPGIAHQVLMLIDPKRALDVVREGRVFLETLHANH